LIRSLGDAGKKVGISTTLALALRRLEAEGSVRRVAVNRRLDAKRYEYVAAEPPPGKPPADERERLRQLAGRFCAWAARASLRHLAWWAGVSQREARDALPAGLVPARIEGWADEALVPERELEALGDRHGRPSRRVLFLPVRDPYLSL